MPCLNSCSGALVLFPVEVVELTEDAAYIQRVAHFTGLCGISQKSPLATQRLLVQTIANHFACGLWRKGGTGRTSFKAMDSAQNGFEFERFGRLPSSRIFVGRGMEASRRMLFDDKGRVSDSLLKELDQCGQCKF